MPGVDFTLQLSLREGCIYYFDDRRLTSEEPHFFIVVNSDPLAQEVLLLSVVTSKVEKVKLFRRQVPQTLVELGPAELPEVFTKDSIVDCNSLFPVPLAEFNARYVRKEIKVFGKDLPRSICDALCRAIHASTVVAEPLKELIRRP